MFGYLKIKKRIAAISELGLRAHGFCEPWELLHKYMDPSGFSRFRSI